MKSFISGSLIRDLFPFSIARMPDKSSNVPSSTVHSAIGAESLRIARASVILKFFNKHEINFNNVCQRKKELLPLCT